MLHAPHSPRCALLELVPPAAAPSGRPTTAWQQHHHQQQQQQGAAARAAAEAAAVQQQRRQQRRPRQRHQCLAHMARRRGGFSLGPPARHGAARVPASCGACLPVRLDGAFRPHQTMVRDPKVSNPPVRMGSRAPIVASTTSARCFQFQFHLK